MVRKIKAKLVLQLRADGLSGRAIAASQQMARKSVTAALEAADAAGVSWDDVADLPRRYSDRCANESVELRLDGRSD